MLNPGKFEWGATVGCCYSKKLGLIRTTITVVGGPDYGPAPRHIQRPFFHFFTRFMHFTHRPSETIEKTTLRFNCLTFLKTMSDITQNSRHGHDRIAKLLVSLTTKVSGSFTST